MSIKVLVADDSSTMRKIIIRSLNACGVQDVSEAGDGQEALDWFKKYQFDFVVTDWNMPVKTGLDVIKEIRESGSTVPIVMVTTESEKHRVLEAIQAGVSDYLVKPFETSALREKLDQLIPV